MEPVTYVLDHRKKNTIQYVPLLKSLQQILNCKVLLDQIIKNHKGQQDIEIDPAYELRSPEDVSHFKENSFFNAEELKFFLRLYVDDFETFILYFFAKALMLKYMVMTRCWNLFCEI